jgi:hypothetical protein
MKENNWMHRTQIYFDDKMFDELKARASHLNLSISEYIRRILKQEFNKNAREASIDFSPYIGIWKNRNKVSRNRRLDDSC